MIGMSKKVTVYSKTICMRCDLAKKYLDNLNIPYDTVNVEEDEYALLYVKQLGAQSMPVIIAEGHEPIFGFAPEKLARLVE